MLGQLSRCGVLFMAEVRSVFVVALLECGSCHADVGLNFVGCYCRRQTTMHGSQHLSARTNCRELYSDNVFSMLSRGRCALHLAVLEALGGELDPSQTSVGSEEDVPKTAQCDTGARGHRNSYQKQSEETKYWRFEYVGTGSDNNDQQEETRKTEESNENDHEFKGRWRYQENNVKGDRAK